MRGPVVLAGAPTFRDVGGLPAAGGTTRSGVLYRSGELSRLNAAGLRDLSALGIRRAIDLRDEREVRAAPGPLAGLGIRVQPVPLFLGSVESFFTDDVSLAEMYRRIVDDAADSVVAVVRGIVEDQPVLVHCTVGKDRTGVTVALALAAAGVDEDAVVAEYARTQDLLPPERNRAVLRHLRERHPDAVHIEDLATRSPAPVMRDLLADLRARHGSPADYLRSHGLPDDEIAELRRVLIAADDR